MRLLEVTDALRGLVCPFNHLLKSLEVRTCGLVYSGSAFGFQSHLDQFLRELATMAKSKTRGQSEAETDQQVYMHQTCLS